MEFNDILGYIANNGFAIVIALYMIIVNNKTVQENTKATDKMNDLLERLIIKLGDAPHE